MKWTPVDAHGSDFVLRFLTSGHNFHALERLQNGSFGLTQTASRPPDHHRLGASRQPEFLKVFFFPALEPGGNFCHFGGSAKWL
jgi:hypothetical protein